MCLSSDVSVSGTVTITNTYYDYVYDGDYLEELTFIGEFLDLLEEIDEYTRTYCSVCYESDDYIIYYIDKDGDGEEDDEIIDSVI